MLRLMCLVARQSRSETLLDDDSGDSTFGADLSGAGQGHEGGMPEVRADHRPGGSFEYDSRGLLTCTGGSACRTRAECGIF